MATSGNVTSSAYSGSTSRSITLTWTRSSYSISNNTSTINWTLKGSGGNTTTYYKAGNFKVNIGGTIVYNSSTRINLYNGTTIASGSYTINHDSDGGKAFGIAIEGAIYSNAVNVSGYNTWNLDTIPRVSAPTVSASSVAFGQSITVNTNRKSSGFTHHLYYSINGATEVGITSGIGASYSWTVPTALMEKIPNSTSATITLRLWTFSGSTNIGSKTVSFTATVPASVVPTCSFNVADDTANYSAYSVYVQGYSKYKITSSGAGSYGSTIKTYVVNADGKTFNGSTVTTDYIVNSGSQNITVKVIDSRGRTSATALKTVTVAPYLNPKITFNAWRCTSSGSTDNEGAYFKCSLSGSISSLNNANTATYKIKYKKSSDSAFTEITGSGLSYTSGVISCAVDIIYNVEGYIIDRKTNSTVAVNIPIAYQLADLYKDGNGISFGKVATRSGFDCAMPSYFGARVQNNSFVYNTPLSSGNGNGYIKFLTIHITGNYANAVHSFDIYNRSQYICNVEFAFNGNGLDPTINFFRCDGSEWVYTVKSSYGTYDFYIYTRTYDLQTICNYTTSIMQDGLESITWRDEYYTALPSGHIEAMKKDRVIAKYNEGIWTCQQWLSGIAECWGYQIVSVQCTTAWGSLYTDANSISQTLPSGLFKQLTSETYALEGADYSMWLMLCGLTNKWTNTRTSQIQCVRGGAPMGGKTNVTVQWNIKGIWK